MKLYSILSFLTAALFISSLAMGQSTSELESRLKKTTSKSEKMNLSYQLAEKYLSSSPQKAADYAHRASMLASELGEKRREAEAIYLTGEAYMRRRDYTQAASQYNYSWNAARNYGLSDVALNSMDRLEEIATKQNDLREALKWSREKVNYLKDNTGRSSSSGDAVRRLELQIKSLEEEKSLLLDKLSQATGQSSNLENTFRETEAQLNEIRERTQEELNKKEETISLITHEKNKVDSLAHYKDMLVSKLTKEQMADSLVRNQQEREIQEQKRLVAEAQLARERSENLRNLLGLLAIFVLLLALLFFMRYLAKKRTANELSEKNKIIGEEQRKIDGLLLNILPPAIAQELKTHNKVAAQKYEKATVMFTDFTGFTQVAEKLSPEDLVTELDFCFSNFDRIISQYNIEKIKTVGDAYICASGLSDKNASPSDMVKAALEIQDFLLHTKAVRLDQGLPFFEARVGIHTGPVVAGVVGKKKFAYDIWGDTVNIAARMEEACEPGRVNISEETYSYAKYEFEWQDRGKVAAKNKGLMDMYYVTSIKRF